MIKRLALPPLLALGLLSLRPSYASDASISACRVAFGEATGYVDCYAERPAGELGLMSAWYGVDVMFSFNEESLYVTPYTSLRLSLDDFILDVEIAAGARVNDLSPRWRFAVTIVYGGE